MQQRNRQKDRTQRPPPLLMPLLLCCRHQHWRTRRTTKFAGKTLSFTALHCLSPFFPLFSSFTPFLRFYCSFVKNRKIAVPLLDSSGYVVVRIVGFLVVVLQGKKEDRITQQQREQNKTVYFIQNHTQISTLFSIQCDMKLSSTSVLMLTCFSLLKLKADKRIWDCSKCINSLFHRKCFPFVSEVSFLLFPMFIVLLKCFCFYSDWDWCVAHEKACFVVLNGKIQTVIWIIWMFIYI